MELLQHYKAFVESVPGNVVDQTGHILRETSEGLKPVVWVGKEAVLPTPEFLANPDWNKYIPFHPMCESIARGESDIIQLAQTFVRISLWDRFIDVARTLLQIAADQSLQTKLTPAQQKLLSAISEADATTLENFGKIIAKSRHDYTDGVDRRIIAVYLRRGGSQDGQRFSRTFVTRFPLYNELLKAEDAKDAKDRKVFDVQLRAKDIPVLKALHETIFPGDESTYTIGTNSNLAPYYTVLLNGYANMAGQLNSIIKPFSKTKGVSLKLIDLSWDEGDNLTRFRNAIPALPHNEGNDPVADPNAAPQSAQPVAQQPVMQTGFTQPMSQPLAQPQAQPAADNFTKPTATIGSTNPSHAAPKPATTNSNTVGWSDLTKQAQPQMGYGMPQQPGYGYGQPMMQPGMPMMQQGMYPNTPQFQPQMQQMQQPNMMYQQAPQGYGYGPVMANGMPQPPMPPTTQPQPQQPQMPNMMQGQPNMMYQPQMPQMMYQQPGMPMMQQPNMMQPQQFAPAFQFVTR